MEYERLLELVGDEPVFETSLLLAGDINPNLVRLQLTRWTKNGRIYQLRRGLYAIAPPYQKVQPHPFLIANHLQRASYVSVQSALAFYGLIPDTVNLTVSITTGRPERLVTPLGIFEFHHIKTRLLFGYRMTDLMGQQALIASPEKALLDLVYLQPGGETSEYLCELRLQNLDRLNLETLLKQSEIYHSRKMRKAVEAITTLSRIETREFEDL
jgi:predicted transcriptional regulator of viral defense system